MNISSLTADDKEFAEETWEAFHTPGIPATGLGQAMLGAARHYNSMNKSEDFRKRAKAQAQMARLNAISNSLYQASIADLAKGAINNSSLEEAYQTLRQIGEIGKRDALADQVRFESSEPAQKIQIATQSAYLDEQGDFEKSRWASIERQYWGGVSKVLVTAYVKEAGLKETLDIGLASREHEMGTEEMATRCRLAALKALREKKFDASSCSRIYEALVAEERVSLAQKGSQAVSREITPAVIKSRSGGPTQG